MEGVSMDMLLRLPEVERATGFKKSAIYKKVKERSFPAPVKTGPKSVAWKLSEVRAWIESRPRANSTF